MKFARQNQTSQRNKTFPEIAPETMFKRVLKILPVRRKLQVLCLLFLMIGTSVLELLTILMVYPLLKIFLKQDLPQSTNKTGYVEAFVTNQSFDSIELALLFMSIFASATIGRYLVARIQYRITASIGIDLSKKAFTRALSQSYEKHLDRKNSEILIGTQKANSIVSYFLQPAITVVYSALLLATILLGLLSYEATLILSGAGCFLLFYLFVTYYTKKQILKNGAVFAKESVTSAQLVQQALASFRDVVINRCQNYFIRSYSASVEKSQRAYADNQILTHGPRYFAELCGLFLILLAAVYLSETRGSSVGIPLIGMFIVSIQRMLPIMNQGYASFSILRGYRSTVSDALTILELPNNDALASISNSQEGFPFSETITIQNVSFRYRDRPNWVLKDFSLEIKRGERIGVVGESGCGKSTLLDLIAGLLEPSAGNILIDNHGLSTDNIRRWQKNIAYVHQSLYLIEGSIAQNIAFGVEEQDIDYPKVAKSAELACLDRSILSWPLGYKTLVGDGGIKLSGGQRQRLGIARALYKSACVLLLDEATSALDTDTEIELMAGLGSLPRHVTIIVVAHRLTSLSYCDRIYNLTTNTLEFQCGLQHKPSELSTVRKYRVTKGQDVN